MSEKEHQRLSAGAALASQPSPAATVERKHLQCERCGEIAVATGTLCDDCAELSIPHPGSSAGNGGALHDIRVLLQAIYDLIDDEEAAEPLDYAIAHAKKALAILDTINEPQAVPVSADAADAARYRYLKMCCSYYYAEGHNPPSPREFGIEWHWQDGTPERADMDTLIDREIEEKRASYAADDEECSCVGAVIGQHDLSCSVTRPK